MAPWISWTASSLHHLRHSAPHEPELPRGHGEIRWQLSSLLSRRTVLKILVFSSALTSIQIKSELEKVAGKEITDEAIQDAIKVYNKNRAARRKFVELAKRALRCHSQPSVLQCCALLLYGETGIHREAGRIERRA